MPKIDGVKVVLVGKLKRADNGSLVAWLGPEDYERTVVLEPRPDTDDMGISSDYDPGPRPEKRQNEGDYIYSERTLPWRKALEAWRSRAYRSEKYDEWCRSFIQQQEQEPDWIGRQRCTFKGKIYDVSGDAVAGHTREELALIVKHFAVSQQRQFKQLQREVKAFNNLEKLTHRELIPESVRIFVWQRDEGKCVECGRRDGLEYDHIIPVAEGGASTERNVQLLCASCNRRKGKNVG